MSNESTGSNRNEISDIAPQQSRHENAAGAISDNKGTIAQGGSATLHDRLGVYIAALALLFAAMSFGMTIVLPMVYQERIESLKDRVHEAEKTAALAREDIRVIQQALAARGIETDPHQQGKK